MTTRMQPPLPELVQEISNSTERLAQLDEVKRKLRVAVGEATDEAHEVLMGNRNDTERKYAASLAVRSYIEHLVGEVLDEKATERGSILP